MYGLRHLLAELLPRWLALWLLVRRVTPIGRERPTRSVTVPELDTGGGFRASWREQNPSADPREPNGGESSSRGSDHGWANCTMTSGALALAYQQPRGALAPWGGDLRHRQGDLEGGTDLYDVRDAWRTYGEDLVIKSGQGWSAVVTAHNDGRAVVIQGTGNVPGSESYDGGHACCIGPETASNGEWLWGDPLASGWQWVPPSKIRSWAEAWQSSIAFAVGEKPTPPPPTPEPVPPPPPCPPATLPGPELERAEELGRELALDQSVGSWVTWLEAGAPLDSDTWSEGRWWPDEDLELDELLEAGPCDPGIVARWGRGELLDPIAAAQLARSNPAQWDGTGWRELLWR